MDTNQILTLLEKFVELDREGKESHNASDRQS